jgi:hypothetical protein
MRERTKMAYVLSITGDEENRPMISYASVPGRGFVIALCVLFVMVTVVVVRAGRRRRERAGGGSAAPWAVADALEPPEAHTVEPPVTRAALPPADVFPAPARWPGMNNSRFGRYAEGPRHFAAAPSTKR